jgi:hypothetical protein
MRKGLVLYNNILAGELNGQALFPEPDRLLYVLTVFYVFNLL